MKASIRNAIVAIACVSAPAISSAQMHDMGHGYGGAFKTGETSGWHIGGAQIDLNGGLFMIPKKDAFDKVSEAFGSLRIQAGTGIDHLQISANALMYSKGSGPQLTSVLQIAPLKNDGRLFLSAGAGGIAGGGSNAIHGWVQGVVAVRTPIHDIAPFVQAGRSTQSGSRWQLLFGASHPLAPYKLHLR